MIEILAIGFAAWLVEYAAGKAAESGAGRLWGRWGDSRKKKMIVREIESAWLDRVNTDNAERVIGYEKNKKLVCACILSEDAGSASNADDLNMKCIKDDDEKKQLNKDFKEFIATVRKMIWANPEIAKKMKNIEVQNKIRMDIEEVSKELKSLRGAVDAALGNTEEIKTAAGGLKAGVEELKEMTSRILAGVIDRSGDPSPVNETMEKNSAEDMAPIEFEFEYDWSNKSYWEFPFECGFDNQALIDIFFSSRNLDPIVCIENKKMKFDGFFAETVSLWRADDLWQRSNGCATPPYNDDRGQRSFWHRRDVLFRIVALKKLFASRPFFNKWNIRMVDGTFFKDFINFDFSDMKANKRDTHTQYKIYGKKGTCGIFYATDGDIERYRLPESDWGCGYLMEHRAASPIAFTAIAYFLAQRELGSLIYEGGTDSKELNCFEYADLKIERC